MQDEPALLQAAIRLDPEALTTIFDRYAPELFKYAYFLCLDEEEADNVVGDTFYLLLEQFSSGKGPEISLRFNIFQIAYCQVIDHAHHIRHLMDLETVIEAPFNRTGTLPKIQFSESTLLKKLLSSLHHDLSEMQRHVLILRFMEGFNVQETASILDKEVDHVKALQKSGIRRLRISLRL
jgi:RNA polymerase sigma-70 factor, ECF subfamily